VSWNEDQIERALRTVVERSLSDRTFRALALTDADAAISAVTNTEAPADLRIRFVDNAGHDMTVVLPDPLEQELPREEELAAMAGGTFTGPYGCIQDSYLCLSTELPKCDPAYTKKPGSAAYCPKAV
jgi:hypothetical protein